MSDEMKHTPGPWEIVAKTKTGALIVGSTSEEADVADVAEEADARLICAAPDMLGALQAVRPFIDGRTTTRDGHEVLALVEKAIAKATGDAR